MYKTFGGRLKFFGIGGSKLDPVVEEFLLKAKFPYAIGYGLTETSPLLSYAMGRGRAVGSIGYPVRGVRLKLHDVNPETGEIYNWVCDGHPCVLYTKYELEDGALIRSFDKEFEEGKVRDTGR